MSPDDRNPLFIPERSPVNRANACPKCGKAEFSGRAVQGVVTFTCRPCGNKWQGGLPQVPVAPGEVLPPERYVPTVRFGKDTKGGDVEIRRRANPTQEFRKGLPEGDD